MSLTHVVRTLITFSLSVACSRQLGCPSSQPIKRTNAWLMQASSMNEISNASISSLVPLLWFLQEILIPQKVGAHFQCRMCSGKYALISRIHVRLHERWCTTWFAVHCTSHMKAEVFAQRRPRRLHIAAHAFCHTLVQVSSHQWTSSDRAMSACMGQKKTIA